LLIIEIDSRATRRRDGTQYDREITIELNPSEQRFYERVRGYVTTPHPGAASSLLDVLLLLPDLGVLLFRLARDARVPFSSKVIAALAVGYVLSPFELMPEIILGPIGLIDDLIVVGTALSRMLNYVHPDVVRSHWAGQGDALAAIQRVTDWTEQNVTSRLRGVVRRVMGTA
jgi:uncharacterized membrane protein YkvA (DUF1232 family)